MPLPRTLAAAAVVALAVAGATTTASTGAPAARPAPRTLASGLLSPLTLAVDDGDVYVTQNFAGVLNKLRPGKDPKTLYASQNGNEVGGVSVEKGSVAFTETASDPETGEPSDSWLKTIGHSGKVRTLAHIRAFEHRTNPDGDITYGARGITDDCAAQWPTDQIGPATYDGIEDSHPYATYQNKNKIYIADAGMNAVLSVTRNGAVHTVAVTPPVAVHITEPLAAAMGLPDCVVGLTYYGESVPTDVEMGPDGKLYVTTEGGGLGESMPLGSVYRINPSSGSLRQVVAGLMAPTGVAVSGKGKLFVAQLFGGEISKVNPGENTVHTFAKTGLPAAVELSRGDVYATTNVLPPEQGAPDGMVVRYRR